MMDFSVRLLGRKEEIAARAEAGDEECKKFIQKVESKSFVPAR